MLLPIPLHAHFSKQNQFGFEVSPMSLRTRGRKFIVTTAVTSEDGKSVYTTGEGGSIIKWDLRTGKKLPLHTSRNS